ncbi:MAG: riboflavin biosynthesis protein RibF, partial [Anaerolineae bacterium]|nr:riboflavin biosynthesis protein RibF [Anaerolineae bacterium]
QHLIAHLVAAARAKGYQAAVLTLFPHPDRVIRGQTGRYYLTTPDEKAELLGALGVDAVVTHPFNDEVRRMRAATFIDLLREHLQMRSLWVTADFALGYKREGNFSFLSAQGQEKGFEVVEIGLLRSEDHRQISSSGIREALLNGDLRTANDWLGRPYRVQGVVIPGDHRGRTIGFPTANLQVWDEQIIPTNGVYACWAWLDGVRHKAVTNIGVRPTFGAADAVRVEAHLLDFDADLYGQTMGLDVVARLRDEMKFSGLDALVSQIRADAAHGRALLSAES